MARLIAVKAAPATTGNDLRGSESSGKKTPNAHTEKVSQHQLVPARWRDVLPVHPAAELFPLMTIRKALLRDSGGRASTPLGVALDLLAEDQEP